MPKINNWGCETGKITTDYLEREIIEMKEAHKLLEARVWKIVVGGQLVIIVIQLISLLK